MVFCVPSQMLVLRLNISLALNISALTLKEFSRYQFLLVRAEKSNVFPVHVLPYFMIWLNCCKYFLWPFYCWNMMAIELFLNSISSKYQKLAVGWADVEFCKIADYIKRYMICIENIVSVNPRYYTVNVHVFILDQICLCEKMQSGVLFPDLRIFCCLKNNIWEDVKSHRYSE